MKVKSVEPAGTTDVYNMEVDDTHNFLIQGGVVAHNCMDAWRYVCMARPIKPTQPQEDREYGDDPLNQRVAKRKSRFIEHGYEVH